MQYRRRIFLINKPFQLKFAFYVCSWLLGLSIFYPLIIYHVFGYFVRYLSLDPLGPPLQALQSTRNEVVVLLASLEILFVAITLLISLFVSHRIAGPLYKLKKTMDETDGLGTLRDVSFRKFDHFQEIASYYNSLLARIRGPSIAPSIGSAPTALKQAVQRLDLWIENSTGEIKPEQRKELDIICVSLKQAIAEQLSK